MRRVDTSAMPWQMPMRRARARPGTSSMSSMLHIYSFHYSVAAMI